jgi:putative salt-induced outer membrane protein
MMKSKQVFLTATIALAAGQAMAAPADGQWRGVAGAALSSTSGNSSTQNLLLNVDMARQTAQDKLSTIGYVNEGRSEVQGQKTTTAGKWGLSGQYDHNLTPEWFGFGKLGFEHDRVTDVSLRTLLGAGLGYHWIQTPETTFDVYGGVSHVNTRYSHEKTIGDDTGKQFNTTGLLLGETSSHKLSDSVSLNQRLEVYPGLTGTKANLAKFNANLSVAMTSTLSLNVGVITTYNSRPGAGLKKTDNAFFTGINLKLGQ